MSAIRAPNGLLGEKAQDGLGQFRRWIVAQGLATEAELDQIETEAVEAARAAQRRAWEAYLAPIREFHQQALAIIPPSEERTALEKLKPVTYREVFEAVHVLLRKFPLAPHQRELLRLYREKVRAARAAV